MNNILIEKHQKMLDYPDSEEQDFWSRTAEGIYRIGHDSIRIMKWIIYNDRPFYGNMNYLI